VKIAFQEEQKFTQWWLWIILIGIGTLPVFEIDKRLSSREKVGINPMSDLGLILFCLAIFSLIGLFWFMRLKTEISDPMKKIKTTNSPSWFLAL
jgi:hypothetical protein